MEFELGDTTECQCGKQIELLDAGVMGWYWSHVATPAEPKTFVACDYENPLSWMRGEEFCANPK